MHNNQHIILDEDVERRITALAEDANRTPAEIVRLALDTYEGLHSKNGDQNKSPYEILLCAGLIGCIEGGPTDLSTNPKYMDGFGNE